MREGHDETLNNAMIVSGSDAPQFSFHASIDFLRVQPFPQATELGSPATELSLTNPRSPHASQLLAWFKERVSHRLAWIDGPQNPWRQIILPLAESSETVMSSVLALAAHDLASQYPRQDPWFVKFTDISNAFQNKALAMLARELSNLTASPSLQSRTDASLTLASVIIICNNELLNAASAGWRIHLQAARELILVNTSQTALQQQLVRIQEFLLQEFFSTTVWTHLTTFDEANQPTNNIPQAPTSTEDAAVADFIRIIHLITRLERLKTASPSPLPTSDIEDIVSQIEAARLKSLRLSETVTFWSDSDRRDFELVVWMFYHANLIYISQAFPELRGERVDVSSSRDQILAHVRHLSETRNGMFAQDLVWPLFVAGTEVAGDVPSQRFVQNAFRDVMRISRTLDRARVVAFLEAWWNYEGPPLESWIQLARERPTDFNFLLL